MNTEVPRNRAALLVIDAQNAMVEAAHRGEELLENLGLLLERARAAETPVIYMRHDHEDYEPMKPGEPGWHVHGDVAPRPGDQVLRKRFSDSFYATTLDEELRNRGVDHLIVTGMNTDFCVDATCRGARNRGYEITLVRDAHTTVNNGILEMLGRGDGPSAAQIVAHHNFLLSNLSHVAPGPSLRVVPTGKVSFGSFDPLKNRGS